MLVSQPRQQDLPASIVVRAPGSLEQAHPPARGHGRADRRAGASRASSFTLEQMPPPTSARPTRCGLRAASAAPTDRRGPRRPRRPASGGCPTARRFRAGDHRHRPGLPLRADRAPVAHSGRDQGRRPDRRQRPRRSATGWTTRCRPPVRPWPRASWPEQRVGPAARGTRPATPTSTSPATTRAGVEIVRANLTEPVHLIAADAGYDAGRGGQAGRVGWRVDEGFDALPGPFRRPDRTSAVPINPLRVVRSRPSRTAPSVAGPRAHRPRLAGRRESRRPGTRP